MKRFIFILMIVLLLPIQVQALEDTNTNQSDDKQVESLYNYISNMKTDSEILKDLNAKDYVKEYMKSGDGKFSFKKIVNAVISYSLKEISTSFKLMAEMLIIAIVCALLNNLQRAFSSDELSNIAYFACYALLIVIISKSFYVAVGLAKDTISEMTNFMAALIPVLMALLASVGGFTEATVMDPIIIGTINLNARIYVNIIIPLILIGFVLQFVNSISDEYKISNLTKLINQVAIWAQGIIMTIFIGVVTIRGITSKTIDQVTVKTAKYAVDNFVPIVGKCLSDAISTVAGYSLLLKNSLSGLGLVIILFLVLYPVVKLIIMSLTFKLTAALIEPVSDKKLVNCISSVGNSITLIMSCVISVSIMFFIMIAIIASAGKMAIGG
ncbi:stage III sporulation protein AE [Clostridium omnivorum]|uniref:Stage III sporulation protein AE n=1 Tax=Clostridium omnivorum TaxID=1604902 RepID=A0ABQ5NAY5_9CLOT|nr:stage III sporulation protein AE [Clostridium sp. E14]GLC32427.1 stage III sporulation protein AE [Clostridium sp. E14]